MKRIILLLVLSVLATLHVYGQYFSKIYPPGTDYKSRIFQVIPAGDNTICSIERVCTVDALCNEIMNVDPSGEIINGFRNIGYLPAYNRTAYRNDTIFIVAHDFNPQDSFFYWKVLLTDMDGILINEYEFPVMHFNNAYVDRRRHLPNLYGITLLKDNQALLWGEGMDKRQPNAGKSPYQSAFLRIGIDGTQKSELFWFEVSDSQRRMANCIADIDGNAVFHYEYRNSIPVGEEKNQLFKSIYKILPNDSIVLINRNIVTLILDDIPCIAVDHQGNYFINPKYYRGVLEGYGAQMSDVAWLSKITPDGQKVWEQPIPPTVITNKNREYTNLYRMKRISTCANGDILCAGGVFVYDSTYNHVSQQMDLLTGFCSFIARFDTEGNVLWRHIIVPYKDNGEFRACQINDIREADDGSIIVGGELERSHITRLVPYSADAWLMKLGPNGCFDDDCTNIDKYWRFPWEVSGVDNQAVQKISSITAIPNPGSHQVQLDFADQVVYPVYYDVVSVTGASYITGTMMTPSDRTIDAGWLASGMYIIYIRDKSGQIGSVKWVKE